MKLRISENVQVNAELNNKTLREIQVLKVLSDAISKLYIKLTLYQNDIRVDAISKCYVELTPISKRYIELMLYPNTI